MMKLKKSFYQQNTLKIARLLLGCILVHESEEGITSGMVIETEAYLGTTDKASHSYGGRHTPRMDPLYKRGGYAYIYQLYGHNYCLNVVTEDEDHPRAVLIRALEPVEGAKLMLNRRGILNFPSKNRVLRDNPVYKLKNLTNGPSKLCQAMGIDARFNGIDLLGDEL
ncbi:MAG: DNA-3-methyladenine glycosylase [Methanothermobacter sp.]